MKFLAIEHVVEEGLGIFQQFCDELGIDIDVVELEKRENVIKIKHEKALLSLEDEEVHIADGFTTDPQINNPTYRILKDDKSCFGRYYSSIIASRMLLDKHPDCHSILLSLQGQINHHEISEMIDDLDTKFKNESLNTSNKPSEEKIAYIEKIAYDFLLKKGLI